MTAEPSGDDDGVSRNELESLRQPPSGEKPRARTATSLTELPFIELEWGDFEKLVERLVELEGDPADYVTRYGVRGQTQEGIDLYSRFWTTGDYTVYQCRRYETLQPNHIRKAVDDFLAKKWSRNDERFAKRFVFCTSHRTSLRRLADEIATQMDRLAKHERPVEFDVWGQEKLSNKLKPHPDLVVDFFDDGLADQFIPGGTRRRLEPDLARLQADVAEIRDQMQSQAASLRLVVQTGIRAAQGGHGASRGVR